MKNHCAHQVFQYKKFYMYTIVVTTQQLAVRIVNFFLYNNTSIFQHLFVMGISLEAETCGPHLCTKWAFHPLLISTDHSVCEAIALIFTANHTSQKWKWQGQNTLHHHSSLKLIIIIYPLLRFSPKISFKKHLNLNINTLSKFQLAIHSSNVTFPSFPSIGGGSFASISSYSSSSSLSPLPFMHIHILLIINTPPSSNIPSYQITSVKFG